MGREPGGTGVGGAKGQHSRVSGGWRSRVNGVLADF